MKKQEKIIFPQLLNVKDVAEMIGISKMQVYNLIHSGDFQSIKFGKRYKVFADSILTYLDNHRNINKQEPKKRGRKPLTEQYRK